MKGLHPNARLHEIPEASLRRLPIYYRFLQQMAVNGASQVSCADLARGLGLDPTQVRKDIEMTGIVGKPRVGYPLGELVRWMENFLGWNRPKGAVLVGAGSLGSALLGYERFRSHGMEIVAAFDIDPEKIGQRIHGREVQPLMFLPDFVRRTRHPAGSDRHPGGGGAIGSGPDGHRRDSRHLELRPRPYPGRRPPVILQNEDLYHSLASLSFKLENRLGVAPAGNGIRYAEDN